MLLKRFYYDKLAQASYLLGCQRTGESLVVDPNRDVGQYIDAAAAEGLRVTHVTETHIHADFLSGSRELAERAGARLLLSDEGGAGWRYGYASPAGAALLREGSTFAIGDIRVDVLHTPGHTPEHVTFVVTDTATSDRPVGLLTGDFVFVGDVGRPDLLERAANVTGTMEQSARALFRSVERFRTLPDYLQVWPGHGAGSACGKSLGAMPSSTVGYERIANWALGTLDEETFVREVLEGQPDPPTYFAEMKRANRDGPPRQHTDSSPQRLDPSALGEALARGELVVDTRSARAFGAGHVAGTVNVPLNKAFPTWMGWIVPYGRPFSIVADEDTQAAEAARDLALIGLDALVGYVPGDAATRWAAEAGRFARVETAPASQLAAELEGDGIAVVDVRSVSEWEAGHVPGARNVPVGHLAARIDELPHAARTYVLCQGGTRSTIAASILQAKGVPGVINVPGGFTEWEREGHAIERADARPAGR